jgi:hypothetical protein
VKTLLILVGLIALLLAGCSDSKSRWSSVTSRPNDWLYLCAKQSQFRSYSDGRGGRQNGLLLTDVRSIAFADIISASSGCNIIVAIRNGFEASLVAAAVERANLPRMKGKVLPTIVDLTMDVHFLSSVNGEWYSTNRFRTRVVSVTCPIGHSGGQGIGQVVEEQMEAMGSVSHY